MYEWGLCDVPFNGVLPEKCLPYWETNPIGIEVFGRHLESAANDLADGFDLTFAYYINVDTLGHTESPTGQLIYDEVKYDFDVKIPRIFSV